MPVSKYGWDGTNTVAIFYGESDEYPDMWVLPECIDHLTLAEPDVHRGKNGNWTCVHCKNLDIPTYIPDEAFLSTLKWNIRRWSKGDKWRVIVGGDECEGIVRKLNTAVEGDKTR